MPAKPAEILIHDGGIQKGEKPDGQMALQSLAVSVKIVEVVFEADPLCVEGLWIEQAGDQAAAFLLGSKPFRQQIYRGPEQPRTGGLVVQDGIGLAAIGFGPVNGTAVEVAWIEQGHRAAFRLRADGVAEPKINHRPSGDGQSKGGKAGVEAPQHLSSNGLVCRRGDVDEFFRVTRVNDFREGNYFFGDHVAVLTAAAGNSRTNEW